MATLLKAACIADLGVRRTRPFPRKEIGQGYLAIDPLPFHMINKSGLIVTFGASDMLVAGSPPRVHIGIHLVTESAEGRGLRKSQKTCKDNEENNDAENKEDLDCLEVSLGAPPRLIEKIDPKDLDQMIKIFYSSHRKASTESQFYNLLELFQGSLSPAGVFIEEKEGDREKWGRPLKKEPMARRIITLLIFVIFSENQETV
jgi:hypothetical protein